MLALYIRVEVLDQLKVGFHITRREQSWAKADQLSPIVRVSKHQRHVCADGNPVETRFPFGGSLARALRRDCQAEYGLTFIDFNHPIDKSGTRSAAIDRNPT